MAKKRRFHGPDMPRPNAPIALDPDGSVDPELADASTHQAANDLRDWRAEVLAWRKRGAELYRVQKKEEREATMHLPEQEESLTYLLELSGASGPESRWGDLFEQISAQDSPAMALYCLYVVMGWDTLSAYRSVFGQKPHVPPSWTQRARPHLTALLSRLMPSRTRLLMHMEELISSPKVDAAVRSGMMQFLARYLLEEPQQGRLEERAERAQDTVRSFVQDTILKRGGVLLIPSEPEVIEVEREAVSYDSNP